MTGGEELISLLDFESFVQRDGDTLTIQLRDRYRPTAPSTDVVEIEGNQVGLGRLGIDANAKKLVRYWRALEVDRGYDLSTVVENFISVQGSNIALGAVTSPFPLWSSVVELVGNMYYLEEMASPPEGVAEKFAEIKSEVNGHAGSDTLSYDDYERRWNVGLPNLFKVIDGFASELRFAKEVLQSNHGIAFRTEGGVDLIVDSEYRVEVTKKRPGGLGVSKEKRISMGDVLESAVRHAYISLRNKQKRNPDVVAVDISGRQPGVEMAALQMLGNAPGLYDFDSGLETALEQCEENLVALLFAPMRSMEYSVTAIPQPVTSEMMRALERLYQRNQLF